MVFEKFVLMLLISLHSPLVSSRTVARLANRASLNPDWDDTIPIAAPAADRQKTTIAAGARTVPIYSTRSYLLKITFSPTQNCLKTIKSVSKLTKIVSNESKLSQNK